MRQHDNILSLPSPSPLGTVVYEVENVRIPAKKNRATTVKFFFKYSFAIFVKALNGFYWCGF